MKRQQSSVQHPTGSKVKISENGETLNVRIQPAGLRSGLVYFGLAAGLWFFTLILILVTFVEPDELVPRVVAIFFGVLGLLFTLGGLNAANRRGTLVIDGKQMCVTEKGLWRARNLAVPLPDVLNVSVGDSNVYINGVPLQHLQLLTQRGQQSFFRGLSAAEIGKIVSAVDHSLKARASASVEDGSHDGDAPPRGWRAVHADQTPIEQKRTLVGFLLACIPIAILLGVGCLVSWIGGMHAIELSRDSDHQVLVTATQKLLMVVSLPPKALTNPTDGSLRAAATKGDKLMTLRGDDGTLTVPGSQSILDDILAFGDDPLEEHKVIYVGNPLAEIGAFIFASIGMVILVLVAFHTVTPLFAPLQTPTHKVRLHDAVNELSKGEVSPTRPLAIYAEQVRLLRILEWVPDQRLRLVSTLPVMWCLAGITLGGCLGLVPTWLFFGYWIRIWCDTTPLGSQWLPWILYVLPGALLGYLFIRVMSPSRSLDVDLRNDTVAWKVGSRAGNQPLSEVRRLNIRPVFEEIDGGDEHSQRSSESGYRSRLEMEVGGNAVVILDTDRAFSLCTDPDEPVQLLKPLATWLAGKLNASVQEVPAIPDAKFLPMLWHEHKVIFCILASMVTLCVLAVASAIIQPMINAKHIRAFGGRVSDYSSSAAGDIVLNNGRQYDFANQPLTDAQFQEIVSIVLRDRKKVALSLTNTDISDASVELLRGASNIVILELSDCKLSDRSAKAIATLDHLVNLGLNCDGEGVTNAGLKELSTLVRLRYLQLGSSQRSPISDPGLKHLENLPNLKHLTLRSTGVTEAGLESFRRINPQTEITAIGY